jgi:hypothetical protein
VDAPPHATNISGNEIHAPPAISHALRALHQSRPTTLALMTRGLPNPLTQSNPFEFYFYFKKKNSNFKILKLKKKKKKKKKKKAEN